VTRHHREVELGVVDEMLSATFMASSMGFGAGLLAFAMVHCACSSPLFAEASACVVFGPRPLSVCFRRVPAFTGSPINGRKSESDRNGHLKRCLIVEWP
jgi:hypothetical protein